MPSSIELHLRVQGEFEATDLTPLNFALYGLLVDWIRHGDEKTAQKIHDGNGSRPFTISPLIFNKTDTDETAQLRVTLLDDNLLAILQKGIHRVRHFSLIKTHFALDEQRITKQETYEEIGAKSISTRNIILQFDTPTNFHRDGKPTAQPDPTMVFTSLFQRWNSFAPAKLQIAYEWMDWVSKSTFISRSESVTETRQYLRRSSMPGFIGKVQYSFIKGRYHGDGDFDGASKVADALANFAYYCGVGVYTSRGFGQTRKLEK